MGCGRPVLFCIWVSFGSVVFGDLWWLVVVNLFFGAVFGLLVEISISCILYDLTKIASGEVTSSPI